TGIAEGAGDRRHPNDTLAYIEKQEGTFRISAGGPIPPDGLVGDSGCPHLSPPADAGRGTSRISVAEPGDTAAPGGDPERPPWGYFSKVESWPVRVCRVKVPSSLSWTSSSPRSSL